MSTYTKKILKFSHQTIGFIAIMLIACTQMSFGATDLDFAEQELNRTARSNLSHLSGNQRQAVNLLDRYQRQKQAQIQAKKSQEAPLVLHAAGKISAPVSSVAENMIVPALSTENLLGINSLNQNDCSQMLANLNAEKLDKEVILKAQQQLSTLGLYKDNVEGRLGKQTRLALTQFCESAQFALSDSLLEMLQNHIDIYKANPNWKQILASDDFVKWSVKQPDHNAIGKTRQHGKSNEVVALLERFKTRITIVAKTDDFHVSYALTKEDFNQLQSTNKIFKLIEKLQGESYATKKEFDAALETVFKGVTDPERYIQLIQKYAEPQTGLMLTEASFNKLKVKNTPDYILQAIQSLKGLNYPDTEINVAVENIISSLVDKTKEFKPEDIIKHAEVSPSGARLSDVSLKKFSDALKKDDPLAPVILEKLQKMKVVEYRNSKTMTAALNNVMTQWVSEINNSVPAIVGETEEVAGYSLSEESMQEINEQLKDFTVPDIYLELVNEMLNVDYPDPDLFWLAAKSKMTLIGTDNSLGITIFGMIEKLKADKVDKVLLDNLREEKVSPAILAQLGTLQDRKFDDSKVLKNEIQAMFDQLKVQFDPYRPLFVAQARKKHPFDKTKSIQWSGESCNCVHDHLAGVVYGFYPYWLAGEKQVIDFSVLTRIGYYGLSFDDKGSIIDASRWSDLDPQFIREARSFNTMVDLVIARNDWSAWSKFTAEEKSVIFKNLTLNIVGLVTIPLTNFTSKAKPVITFGGSPAPIMGDGVTLYFEGYPQDKESVDAFHGFTRILSDALRAQKRKFSINFMFRSSDMGKGIFDHYKLKEVMDSIEGGDKSLETNFLILLEEPTAINKKQLRINIENEMHAMDRVTMLRNIVLIRASDKNNKQIIDDIVYAKDDYGGIGFWPQPFGVVGNAADNGISNLLNSYYLDNVDAVSSRKQEVCHYICPNKWVFRISWEIFALIFLVCVYLYFMRCESRVFLDKHFIYVIAGIVAPFFLLSMALMYCDPFLSGIFKGHIFLILLLVAVFSYSIWNHQDKKRKANLP